jgi:acyl-coenzyme A thioesterase PaaI-like protein
VPAVLDRYKSLSTKPFGKRIFSLVFAQKAPYFATIRPYFAELRPHSAEVHLPKRRKVHNQIKTVHVIAIANGLEAAMGALAEATISSTKRWIPKGMQLEYTAKATSDIVCTAETDPVDWESSDVPARVTARREDGTVVVQGVINLYVSDKPARVAAAAKA